MKKILAALAVVLCVFSLGGCFFGNMMEDSDSDYLRDKMLAAIEAEDPTAAAEYCVDDIANDLDSLETSMKAIKGVIEGTSLEWKITNRSKGVGTGYSIVESVYTATEDGYKYELEMTVDKYGEAPLISYFYISRTEANQLS